MFPITSTIRSSRFSRYKGFWSLSGNDKPPNSRFNSFSLLSGNEKCPNYQFKSFSSLSGNKKISNNRYNTFSPISGKKKSSIPRFSRYREFLSLSGGDNKFLNPQFSRYNTFSSLSGNGNFSKHQFNSFSQILGKNKPPISQFTRFNGFSSLSGNDKISNNQYTSFSPISGKNKPPISQFSRYQGFWSLSGNNNFSKRQFNTFSPISGKNKSPIPQFSRYREFLSLSGGGDKPPTLNNINEVAMYVKENVKNIFVMVGAGISTPSGIPDFRTPGTGLYDNLQKFNLPYPEAIFDINYFMMDPRPFYTLAKDLYPGLNYTPSIGHYFLRLLYEEGILQKVYTQNIDGLERLAGIPNDKLFEAHGTFQTASCTLCGMVSPVQYVKEEILKGGVPHCKERGCKGKVKPDIVFFGENLPVEFWDFQNILPYTDLLLIIGTSLEVYPFASIAEAANLSTPRVLVNYGVSGGIGYRKGDVLLLGDLVETFQKLAEALGWRERLEGLMEGRRD